MIPLFLGFRKGLARWLALGAGILFLFSVDVPISHDHPALALQSGITNEKVEELDEGTKVKPRWSNEEDEWLKKKLPEIR